MKGTRVLNSFQLFDDRLSVLNRLPGHVLLLLCGGPLLDPGGGYTIIRLLYFSIRLSQS